mmetsp:Transcript_45302/g.79768  ORF Transcript_45302/g.79768 Transcript_45302/m.79768 type:complete len:252 (-) Transcript_45302:754-1509(-)
MCSIPSATIYISPLTLSCHCNWILSARLLLCFSGAAALALLLLGAFALPLGQDGSARRGVHVNSALCLPCSLMRCHIRVRELHVILFTLKDCGLFCFRSKLIKRTVDALLLPRVALCFFLGLILRHIALRQAPTVSALEDDGLLFCFQCSETIRNFEATAIPLSAHCALSQREFLWQFLHLRRAIFSRRSPVGKKCGGVGRGRLLLVLCACAMLRQALYFRFILLDILNLGAKVGSARNFLRLHLAVDMLS